MSSIDSWRDNDDDDILRYIVALSFKSVSFHAIPVSAWSPVLTRGALTDPFNVVPLVGWPGVLAFNLDSLSI